MLHAPGPQQPLVSAALLTKFWDIRSIHRTASRRLQQAHCSSNFVQQSSVRVREAETDDELETCARIRASAYYGELLTNPRFVINLERQFARDEFQALVRRTRDLPGVGSPKAVCIVALDAAGIVVGSLDLRPPFNKTGLQPDGVPQDGNAAFLANLAVETRARKQGFGTALLRHALITAQQQLQADRVYAHVDGTNPAACSLYERAGFERSACQKGTTLRSGIVVLVAEIERDHMAEE